ncbi:MAG: hypothetical protein KAY27_00085 [Pedobacter sp.]|jgi:hypothetical protein|nr:hypothetical protein [Pedobacter sp.]
MCEILSGFNTLNCDSVGGVATWYIGSLRDEATGAANYTYSRTDGSLTAMANVGLKLFYTITVDVEMSDFSVKSIGTRENASSGFEIAGNIKLAGNTASMIQQLEDLSKDRLCLIATLNDGSLEVLGLDNGVKFNFERTSGSKFEEMNGVTLTFAGKEKKNAPKVSSVIAAALLV